MSPYRESQPGAFFVDSDGDIFRYSEIISVLLDNHDEPYTCTVTFKCRERNYIRHEDGVRLIKELTCSI